jgi:hypothetical protein
MKHPIIQEVGTLEFPSLSRDLSGVWLDSGADILQQIRHDLFKHPKFGIVMPGLGRHAVRSNGLQHAIQNTVELASTLPKTRSFTVEEVVDDFSNGSHIIGLSPTLTERVALNEERQIAQTALGSHRSQNFNLLAIMQTKDRAFAHDAMETLRAYFAHDVNAPLLTLDQPTLTIKK